MRVTVLPIMIRAQGTVPKSLEKSLDKLEIRKMIMTTTTAAL